MRAWSGFNYFMDVVSPKQEAVKITTGQVEDYIDYRVAMGVCILTPRRELIFVKAAAANAFRRNRIALLPYFELPDGEQKVRRPLTETEFRLVMSKPMSKRLRRFYWIAYYTGHRSKAIEELQWPRLDLVGRTIDFNVPGRLINNKRRAKDFPIPDDFMPRLRAWREQATGGDDYVIGRGAVRTNETATTYHEAAYVVRELCGIKDPTLVPRHCMRSMFATELIDLMIRKTGQADMETVGRLMADKPDTVRSSYMQHKEATLREASNLRTLAALA